MQQKAEKVDVSKIKIAFVPVCCCSDGCQLSRRRASQDQLLQGTGNMGLKLARNHAKHSEVIIGSREQKKAEAAAEAIRKVLGEKTRIKGMTNEAAAASADVVFFCAQGSLDDRAAVLKSLADSLKNKIVVDIVRFFVDSLSLRHGMHRLTAASVDSSPTFCALQTNIAYISSFFTEKVWGQTCSTEQCMAAIPDVPIKWCCAYKVVAVVGCCGSSSSANLIIHSCLRRDSRDRWSCLPWSLVYSTLIRV